MAPPSFYSVREWLRSNTDRPRARSAAEAAAFLAAKTLVVECARRHGSTFDRLANVRIAAQVRALVEAVIAPAIAAPASPIVVLSIPKIAAAGAGATIAVVTVAEATIAIPVVAVAIGLRRGRAHDADQAQTYGRCCTKWLHVACLSSSGVGNAAGRDTGPFVPSLTRLQTPVVDGAETRGDFKRS